MNSASIDYKDLEILKKKIQSVNFFKRDTENPLDDGVYTLLTAYYLGMMAVLDDDYPDSNYYSSKMKMIYEDE